MRAGWRLGAGVGQEKGGTQHALKKHVKPHINTPINITQSTP